MAARGCPGQRTALQIEVFAEVEFPGLLVLDQLPHESLKHRLVVDLALGDVEATALDELLP